MTVSDGSVVRLLISWGVLLNVAVDEEQLQIHTQGGVPSDRCEE